MEALIRDTNLEWTLVRPPQLTNGPFTGRYRQRINHLPFFGFRISRADVADYFIQSLHNPDVLRRIVGISN